MPYITKLETKRGKNPTPKQVLRSHLYNNTRWRRIRDGYLILHPLCQLCEAKGLASPSQCVHHLASPFDDGLADVERLGRLTDPANLQALCQSCHGKLHRVGVGKK